MHSIPLDLEIGVERVLSYSFTVFFHDVRAQLSAEYRKCAPALTCVTNLGLTLSSSLTLKKHDIIVMSLGHSAHIPAARTVACAISLLKKY